MLADGLNADAIVGHHVIVSSLSSNRDTRSIFISGDYISRVRVACMPHRVVVSAIVNHDPSLCIGHCAVTDAANPITGQGVMMRTICIRCDVDTDRISMDVVPVDQVLVCTIPDLYTLPRVISFRRGVTLDVVTPDSVVMRLLANYDHRGVEIVAVDIKKLQRSIGTTSQEATTGFELAKVHNYFGRGPTENTRV